MAEASKRTSGEPSPDAGKIERTLAADEVIKPIAKEYFKARGFIYLARGINYPIALRALLKLRRYPTFYAGRLSGR